MHTGHASRCASWAFLLCQKHHLTSDLEMSHELSLVCSPRPPPSLPALFSVIFLSPDLEMISPHELSTVVL